MRARGHVYNQLAQSGVWKSSFDQHRMIVDCYEWTSSIMRDEQINEILNLIYKKGYCENINFHGQINWVFLFVFHDSADVRFINSHNFSFTFFFP